MPDQNLNRSTAVPSSLQQADYTDNEPGPLNTSNTSRNDFNCWSVDTDSCTLPISSDPWQFTAEDCRVFLDHIGDWETGNTTPDSIFANFNTPNGSDATTSPGILRTPAHLPTMLIEHWFGYICPMWSAFDSAVSYNRQLAWSSWSSSKAVFYTMQAMSAAYLLVTMPYFYETLYSLRSLAVAAINEDIGLVRTSQSPKVKYDLVYAVFILGNSLHWTASRISENPWLKSARELMSIWTLDMSISDVPIYSYFCQALTYWEMLLAARGCGSVLEKLAKKRQRYYAKIQQAIGLADSSNNIVPYESPMDSV